VPRLYKNFFNSHGFKIINIGTDCIDGIAGGRKGARNLKEITVKVYDNDIEKAIRILKKKIQNDGLFKRLKLKKSYEKPSEFRRRKQREALRRERIAAARRAYRR
jgi:small subunit ribosomal protein S21